jgi:hypothetical protein
MTKDECIERLEKSLDLGMMPGFICECETCQAKRFAISILKRVDEEEIKTLLIDTIHLDEPIRKVGAIVNGKDTAFEIVKDIAHTIVEYQEGGKK